MFVVWCGFLLYVCSVREPEQSVITHLPRFLRACTEDHRCYPLADGCCWSTAGNRRQLLPNRRWLRVN